MSDLSAFDPSTFLLQSNSQGFDTRYPLHKPGDFVGYVGDKDKDIQIRDAKDKETGESYKILEIILRTDDEKALGEGMEPPARVRWSAFLDLTSDGKGLDFSKGKNRQLGQLLMALGFQDKDGVTTKAWSFAAMPRLSLRYTVVHKPRKDTGEPQDSVSRVGKL